jgi:hypothetical protein
MCGCPDLEACEDHLDYLNKVQPLKAGSIVRMVVTFPHLVALPATVGFALVKDVPVG